MCKILIFGGTTEGRLLAEYCVSENVPAWLSVASEYGEEILDSVANTSLKILQGRMDRYQIEDFIKSQKINLVIDATHPHARLVSEEIKEACNGTDCQLYRCIRLEGDNKLDDKCVMVDSIDEAVDFLASVDGVILSTTGSKELEALCRIPDYQKRLFARVLPTSKVLKKCEDLGITGNHLIAMQGPFSTEMNVLFLRQTKANWLLTKDSGLAGGFQEKILAAHETGTKVVVIRRPKENGITLDECKKVIFKEALEKTNLENLDVSMNQIAGDEHVFENTSMTDDIHNTPNTHIILAGIGMGNFSQMTVETVCAIRESDAIIGASRMLKSAKNIITDDHKFYNAYLPDDVMRIIEEHPEWKQAVVLYSGDTGFFSGATKMSAKLKDVGYSFQLYPGISCIGYMAAKIGVNWEDAAIYSAHGRKLSVIDVVNRLSDPSENFEKAFVLMGGKNGAGEFCKELTKLGFENVSVTVGENLSYENEQIRSGSAKDMAKIEFAELCLLFIDVTDRMNDVDHMNVHNHMNSLEKMDKIIPQFPKFMIAAPKSGSGKTLITCGMLEILRRRGLNPVACKCGPDYIDPMFHRYVLGISGRNLDSFFLPANGVRDILSSAVSEEKADIAVLEGVMGYYDGLGGIKEAASSWEIADITDTKAILVIDCKGSSLSAAALISGFLNFKKNSHIAGVILNRVSSMYYGVLASAIEELCKIPVLGYLPESKEYHMESRHLGLFMPGEIDHLRESIEKLADQMEKSVDVDRILEIAGMALTSKHNKFNQKTEILPETVEKAVSEDSELIIGVARDEAFCFYYQENLHMLKQMGAKLIYFSPLRDKKIPDGINGLIFGGGYPENYAKELSENTEMLESVRSGIGSGMPFLAECGGFMYLHKSLEGLDGRIWQMAGIYPYEAYKTNKLSRFGYVRLLTPSGLEIHGHEFHYWESENPGTDWKAVKPTGKRDWRCIHENGAQIGGFPHLYYPSCKDFLSGWFKACKNRSTI